MTNVYLVFSDKAVNLTELAGIKLQDINISFPVPKNEFVSFADSIGQRLVSQSYDSFPLTFEFDLKCKNREDVILKDLELRKLFYREPEYHFLYDQEPGKKYPVAIDSITPTFKTFYMKHYVVNFTVYKGYAESITSTLSEFNLKDEWQFSQGLVAKDYEYTFTHSRFIVYNAGDFTVDPRENYLKIQIEGESDGEITIVNKTTKERFIYRPRLSSVMGEWIDIIGVYPRKNGISCGIDTNHGLISLVPGINEIEIQNVSQVKSSWDFNFLYK